MSEPPHLNHNGDPWTTQSILGQKKGQALQRHEGVQLDFDARRKDGHQPPGLLLPLSAACGLSFSDMLVDR